MNPHALIGHRLADKYTLQSLLGVGGFGAVYRAIQAPIDRVVAVKINLHPHRHDMVARFVREARVQAGLRHPGCVMLLDCGESDGRFYLVQEYVDGRSLKALLLDEGPLAPARAVELVGQILDALAEAHRHGVVHRDIKPANIMLTHGIGDREEVRVLDFGIAKIVGEPIDDGDHLTESGMALGTPAYMAPEQVRPGAIGPATDVYAVGATLYHVLTGRPPFIGPRIDVMMQHLSTAPPTTGDAGLDAIVARAMHKDPDARYSSAAAMRAALMALDPAAPTPPTASGAGAVPGLAPTDARVDDTLRTDPTTGGTPSFVGSVAEPPEPPRRRRGTLIGAGAVALGGTALALTALLGAEPDPQPDPQPTTRLTVGHAAPEAAPDATQPDATPDAATPDAAPPDAAAPDAAPPARTPPKRVPSKRRPLRPRPPDPTPPDPDRLARDAARALDRCACPAAGRAITALDGLRDTRTAALRQRHEEQCQLFLPGNCRTRDR